MSDLANLQIRVQSLEAEVADARLNKLAKSGGKAERATDGLGQAFVRLAGPAAITAGIMASLAKITQVTREFEVFKAQLVTATGTVENANEAFKALQDFAQDTPYGLAQATEGFTKLVNLGLTPSERAMRSYGDTASALGKDFMQMVEAVDDAATGQFERLKEFGIKASNQGSTIAFTFRGIKTEVANNAAEIEEYLIALGENNFAGEMQRRMATLDGAIANLGDEWEVLWYNIGQMGIGATIEEGFRKAGDGIADMNTSLESGQTQAYIDAIMDRFNNLFDGTDEGMQFITDLWNDLPEEWRTKASDAVDFIIQGFKELPENVKATIQLMVVEIASLVDYGREYASAFVDVMVAKFEELVAKAKLYGKALGEALNPFGDSTFSLDAEIARVEAKYKAHSEDTWKIANENAERIAQARRDSITSILDERQSSLDSFNEQIDKADELKKEYIKLREEREKNQGDRLEKFGLGKSSEVNSDADSKKSSQLAKQREREFKALVDSLRTEEEVIQQSYDKRLQIILDNTIAGSEQQRELKKRLDEEFKEQALGDLGLAQTHDQELEKLQEYYDRRRELILNSVALTEQERTDLELQLTTQRNLAIQNLEQQRISAILTASSSLFDGLAGLAKAHGGEQNKLYKAMFAASKAFAIADSVIKIQQGIASASSVPWPANLAAIASTIAATGSVISTISSTTMQFAGAYDNGGMIPAGKTGLVGEYGPEFITGPAIVTSRKQTADMLGGNSGGQMSNTTVNIYNNAQGTTASYEESMTENGKVINVIVDKAKSELAKDVSEGGGLFSQSMERTYGLQRGKQP